MGIRLWSKAIKMMFREKKIFVIFTLIYTILIFLTSFFLEIVLSTGGGLTVYFVLIFFFISLILSLLYAWIIVARNRRVYATLKCLGWKNSDINFLISGVILFTTITGFIVVLEGLFHYTAIIAYLHSSNVLLRIPAILVSLLPVVTTFGIFLLVQLLAIILANRRVLKVRPIIALKRVGE